jgi:hypothetical protein
MHKSSHSTSWEYKLVSMGNPLEPDTELRANTVGKLRWELAAIDAGVWIFKRPCLEESATGLQAIMEETVPMTEQEPALGTSFQQATISRQETARTIMPWDGPEGPPTHDRERA